MPCSQLQGFVQTSSNNVTHPWTQHKYIHKEKLKIIKISVPHLTLKCIHSQHHDIYVNIVDTHVSTVTPPSPLVSPCLSVGCLPTSEDHVAAAQQRNVDEAGSSSERGPAIRPSRSRLLSGFTNLAASPYHPCMVCIVPPLPVTGTTMNNNDFLGREFSKNTFICHYYWEGGQPSVWYIYSTYMNGCFFNGEILGKYR